MKTKDLIKTKFCADYREPADSMLGKWRNGYRKPSDETRHVTHERGKGWLAFDLGAAGSIVRGPFPTMQAAFSC